MQKEPVRLTLGRCTESGAARQDVDKKKPEWCPLQIEALQATLGCRTRRSTAIKYGLTQSRPGLATKRKLPQGAPR